MRLLGGIRTAEFQGGSAGGRIPAEADDIAIGVLNVEVHGAPRGHPQWFDDPCAVRYASRVERLDAIDAGGGIEMLVLAPVLTLSVTLGRFLQVEFQSVKLADARRTRPTAHRR